MLQIPKSEDFSVTPEWARSIALSMMALWFDQSKLNKTDQNM